MSLRLKQWIKNLFVFAALIFSRNLLNIPLLIKAIEAFFIYCLLSSASYLINDITDIDNDKKHPLKSKRPIPSGRLSIANALIVSLLLFSVSILWTLWISQVFFYLSLLFIFLQMLYSFVLKNILIVDAMTIATSFVLRMIAGALAINASISRWLYICTIFLSLFIAFCKRRAEIIIQEETQVYQQTRPGYSSYLLDHIISTVTASTLIAYTLYTLSEETISRFGPTMIFTITFVFYALFRYQYLLYQKQQCGEPESIILTDVPLLVSVLLWGIFVLTILLLSK